jgi:hypothetical protein
MALDERPILLAVERSATGFEAFAEIVAAG